MPKRRILVFTQTTLMVLAFTLAFLVGNGQIRYWMLLVLATVGGITNTIDMPARQSFIIELVGKEHLTNAIALNSAIFNGARIVGPAVAGMIMDLWGATWCFIINGLGLFSVIIAFQTTYLGAAAVLAFVGWSMLVFSASANSLIQTTVDNRLRGRIMSVYSLSPSEQHR